MAIDTREKRFAMLNMGRVPQDNLFEADSSVDADDRAHLLALYGGIALAAPGGFQPVWAIEATFVQSLQGMS